MERLKEATPGRTVLLEMVWEVDLKASSIKKHLKPNTIRGRKSTFSNAFASALAPYDEYSEAAVAEAIDDLDQDPTEDLYCVYCGKEAATWDHVFNRVVNGEFSGYGHRIRNLVPCCRTCNERKGKKHWKTFLKLLNADDIDQRIGRMERFLHAHSAPSDYEIIKSMAPEELNQFLQIRDQIFRLMVEADQLADSIRKKATS
ncbi:HNH endonuclease [uncultured Roseobacter sp.]|uniref:HNH endonuclease n=1 Tax=uncultured Roseobacter sp. TaxID=114847 RepID=UPI0026170631|nr:HNH endonuclease [uncultured Roseobacter sp.]